MAMDEFDYPDYDRFEDELYEHECNELARDAEAGELNDEDTDWDYESEEDGDE